MRHLAIEQRLSRPKPATLPARFAAWFSSRGWRPHAHELAMLEAAGREASALLIAPTGGGKTLAGFLGRITRSARLALKRTHATDPR